MQGRKTTNCEEAENDQMCGRTRCKEDKQPDVKKKNIGSEEENNKI